MPQHNNQSNITLNQKDCMSTILIHKQSETNQIQKTPKIKYQDPAIENASQFHWEDVAGLSWTLLDEEDF